jgi:hypothetical protein
MQPPSEADVVASTKFLTARRDLKLDQVNSLEHIRQALAQLDKGERDDLLLNAVSSYLGHLATEHQMDADILTVQIANNERALQAYRSGIVLPTFTQRKPSN